MSGKSSSGEFRCCIKGKFLEALDDAVERTGASRGDLLQMLIVLKLPDLLEQLEGARLPQTSPSPTVPTVRNGVAPKTAPTPVPVEASNLNEPFDF